MIELAPRRELTPEVRLARLLAQPVRLAAHSGPEERQMGTQHSRAHSQRHRLQEFVLHDLSHLQPSSLLLSRAGTSPTQLDRAYLVAAERSWEAEHPHPHQANVEFGQSAKSRLALVVLVARRTGSTGTLYRLARAARRDQAHTQEHQVSAIAHVLSAQVAASRHS